MRIRHLIVLGVILFGLSSGLADLGRPGGNRPLVLGRLETARPDLLRLPLSFEENCGQFPGPAKFLTRRPNYALFLEPAEAVLMLNRPGAEAPATLKIRLVGASPAARLAAEERLPGLSNYFLGSDPSSWRTGVPHFAKVRAFDVYPGIDLVYYGNQTELEFDLAIAPGADPSQIVLALDGAKSIEIDERGDLLAGVEEGTVRLRRPQVYQDSDRGPERIDGSFVLRDANRIAFEVADYDRARPLVIDPAIVYATYFGSGGYEMMSGGAVDGSGNICFQGSTQSAGFPTTNALCPFPPGGLFDVFVAKVNAAGNTLLFSTYFGGSGRDTGSGIAVDADGDIYISGCTTSANFPLVSALQPTFGGNGRIGFGDAFLTKIKSDGSALVYSTYLGGNGDDLAMGVSVDIGENAYVGGVTESTNFPTSNAYQGTLRGDGDAFVSKVNPSGTAFVFSTYLGGSGRETSYGFGHGDIAATPDGCACVAGFTNSTDFPLANAFQSAFGGSGSNNCGDVFVTKFSSSGQALVFSTLLGGTSDDMGEAIAADASGAVYVSGRTKSANFPTFNPFQANHGGGDSDSFVTVFNSDGTVRYSTFLGGSGYESSGDIAVNGLGNAHVAGGTPSPNFPTADPIQGALSGESDAFIAAFSADGSTLAFSTFLGGTAGDAARSIDLDAGGNMYIVGGASPGFPVKPSPSAFIGDLFLAKIEAVVVIPGPTLTSLLPSSASAGDPGFPLSVIGTDFVDGAVVRWDGDDRTTTFVSGSEVQASIPASDLVSGKTVSVTVRNPDTGTSNALSFTIDNPAPTLNSISPTTASGGCAAFTLTVAGTDFVPNSVVRWNGVAKTTTYVSGTELQAAIDAACLATPGDVQVTVANPAPAGGTSTAASFALAGYAIAPDPASVTVSAGQSATYTVSLTPQYGAFDSAVAFSCSGLPSKCTATFVPASVTPGGAAATATLTLATRASATTTAAALSGTAALLPPASGLALLVLGLVLAPRLSHIFGRRVTRRWAAACALMVLAILIGGCSSGGGGGDGDDNTYTGTPKGTHAITVNAVSGSLTVTSTVTLVVN